eukprot:Em0004g1554a
MLSEDKAAITAVAETLKADVTLQNSRKSLDSSEPPSPAPPGQSCGLIYVNHTYTTSIQNYHVLCPSFQLTPVPGSKEMVTLFAIPARPSRWDPRLNTDVSGILGVWHLVWPVLVSSPVLHTAAQHSQRDESYYVSSRVAGPPLGRCSSSPRTLSMTSSSDTSITSCSTPVASHVEVHLLHGQLLQNEQ